jgi:hypothetical protein
MSARAVEALLARLYTDEPTRRRFLADPVRAGRRAGLSADECAALEQIDRLGLELAARSYARKRARAAGHTPPRSRLGAAVRRWFIPRR